MQTNIFYHTIRLILCLQQTGEIDNLTANWGKVLWLCCVQVPRCRWCQSYTLDKASYINCLESSPSQLASTIGSGFFLLLVRLNLGFILSETCRCAHHTFLLGFPTGWLAPPITQLDLLCGFQRRSELRQEMLCLAQPSYPRMQPETCLWHTSIYFTIKGVSCHSYRINSMNKG
jgi:hypothetical protein